jgi:hypothetical protein
VNTNFTNEEVILENEIKRKDTISLKYIPPVQIFRNGVGMFHGSSMLVVTNKEEKKAI